MRIAKIVLLLFILAGVSLGAACAAGIVIYGDSRTNHDVHRSVIAAILKEKPMAVFHLGDLVDEGMRQEDWEAFRSVSAELRKSVPFYPVLGNHENNAAQYFEFFNLPNNERWYSVDIGDIHLCILDAYSSLVADSEQYRWLLSDLQQRKPQTRFTIILLHPPLFSVGRHLGGDEQLRSALLPLLERFRVNAVFSGHDHNYQRFVYGGIAFVVSAGGGAPLYAQQGDNPYLKKFAAQYHFCLLVKKGRSLFVRVLDSEGRLIDKFSLNKKRFFLF